MVSIRQKETQALSKYTQMLPGYPASWGIAKVPAIRCMLGSILSERDIRIQCNRFTSSIIINYNLTHFDRCIWESK